MLRPRSHWSRPFARIPPAPARNRATPVRAPVRSAVGLPAASSPECSCGVSGAEFVNSIAPEPFDPQVGRHLPAPGSELRFRTEGAATTRYAAHGLLADDVEARAEIEVGVWGDSFVQGAQVADDQKFGAAFRELWNAEASATTVAVGYPDRSIGDVIALLPRYEDLRDFDAHVVLLPDLFDVSPDGKTFFDRPDFRFVERRRDPPWEGLRARVADVRLDFTWFSFQRVVGAKRNPIGGEALRWRVGPAASSAPALRRWPALYEVDPAAWRFALQALRRATDQPVAIVYAPRVPFLDKGRVRREHPVTDLAARFAAMCREEGVDFVDLSPALAKHFERTGQPALGFHNGRMGRGHLNAAGHEILAEALVDWVKSTLIEEGAGAVHPD